jgi:hypothetical protein
MHRKANLILSTVAFVVALGPAVAQADETGANAEASCETGLPHSDHGRHGPVGLLHAALEESIGLSSEQRRAIETTLASLRPAPRDEAAHAEHRAALAAAIRAGRVDETALIAAGPTAEERAAHEAAFATAAGRLHAILTADQRQALVTAVLAKHTAHDSSPEAHAHDGGPMHLFGDLGLTDDQKVTVRAALDAGRPDEATMRARFAAMNADHEARLQSFVADTFDARAFVAPPADAETGNRPNDPMVHDLAIVVPLLTAAQRERLAQRIEAGPPPQG